MKLENEPTLSQSDDYDNNESPEKRKTIRLIVVGILIVGTLFGLLKYYSNLTPPSDYVGTAENPGMTLFKN